VVGPTCALSPRAERPVTITNDAVRQDLRARQHFAQASMRAIENGRYLVRAANTGISGVVDPYGGLAASPIFEPAVRERGAVPASFTLYTRIGDVRARAVRHAGDAHRRAPAYNRKIHGVGGPAGRLVD
jgi:apolipoprotein N-acyltransferase